MIIRCKHFCCREGVDKAPKAPKQSAVLKDNGLTRRETSAKKPKSTIITTPSSRTTSKLHQSRIEVLDLASEPEAIGTPSASSRNPPGSRMFKLSAAKKAPVLLSISDRPEFISAKNLDAQLSISSQVGTDKNFIDEDSSDFEASWMDGLPSPSTLLKDDAENLPWALQQEPVVGRCPTLGDDPSNKGLESQDFEGPSFAHFQDYNQLIDTGESADGKELDQQQYDVEHDGTQDSSREYFDSLPMPTRSLDVIEYTQTEPKHDRLFLSVDSPEKAPIAARNSDEDDGSRALDNLDEPPRKRQCFEHQKPTGLFQASSNAGNRVQRLEDLRKRLPWNNIEDGELEFLLDLDIADIVEFV